MRYRYWIVCTLTLLNTAPAASAQSAADQEFLFAYRLMQRGDTAEAGAAFDTFLEKFPSDAQRGDALYFRAVLYRRAGALRAASELLAGATGSARPRRVPVYAVSLLRGQVLTDLGDYDAALQQLEAVDPAVVPDNVLSSTRLLQAVAQRGAGNYEAAAASARRAAVEGSPVRERATLELARALALGGDPAAGLETLQGVTDADDPAVRAEASRYAGDLAFTLERYDDAAGHYTAVIERGQASAEFAPAVVGRMWADFKAGRNVAVINAHQQLADTLAHEPRGTADYLAASAYQGVDQHARAAELLTGYLAAAINGNNQTELTPLALYKLAVSQFELARYDDLARTVNRLEANHPESPQQIDASFLLATADAKQGKAAAGVQRLAGFIERGPDDPYHFQALLRRASLYEQTGELAAAADDLRAYLDARGVAESPTVTLRFVDVSHRLGRYDTAAATAEELLATDPPDAAAQEALYRLGEAQARQRQYREALANYDTLQREHPINPYRHAVDLRRGLLLNQLGRPEEAMDVLATAANDPKLPGAQRVAALRIISAYLRDAARPADAATALGQMERLGGLEALTDAEVLWRADHAVAIEDPVEALRLLAVFESPGRRLQGVAESERLYTRGRAHFARGDFDEAHRSFFGVVALGRGFDLDARLQLARTETARGNLDAALMELSDLVRAEDGGIQAKALYATGEAHRQRAAAAQRRGETADADADQLAARAAFKRLAVLFLTVDAVYPRPAQALVQLAEIADERGEAEAMVRELNELQRAFPGTPYAEYAMAVLSQKDRNRPDDALSRLQRLDVETLDPVLRGRVEAKVRELEAMR
ncbi:MAG: tetratricopeptide repeat protein [Planctomycetota bacterium]